MKLLSTTFGKSALTVAMIALFGTGCAQFVPPKQMQARIIETTRGNIITTPRLSSLAESVLLSSGLNHETCMADFDGCLHDLQSAFFGDRLDKEALVLMAELHYAHALHLSDKTECKPTLDRPPIDDYYTNAPVDKAVLAQQAQDRQDCLTAYRDALYRTVALSYGYLFFDDLTHQTTHQNVITDNDIRAQDLYHVATNALIQEIYKEKSGAFADAISTEYTTDASVVNELGQRKVVTISSKNTDNQDFRINFHLSDDQEHLQYLEKYGKDALSDLISIYDYRLANLQVNSTRSGLGVGFVASLQKRHTTAYSTTQDAAAQSRIHPMGHLLVTGMAIPKGHTLEQVLGSRDIDVYFFNPYNTQQINILGKDYPLSASFSSTYATWLSENNMQRVSLMNMVAKKDAATLPELFMLSPYNPDQKVIIMIHGLASSPATWVNLTNNLLSDPILREHYQVWQIFYATNLPILENRYQIYQLINETFNSTDPTHEHAASHGATLIGHSMGGVISRMLVSDDDLSSKLSNLHANEDTSIIKDTAQASDEHEATPNLNDAQSQVATRLLAQTYRSELGDRFVLHALPQVDTAIFISAPFRGTDYADRWFTRAARRVIRLPLNLTKGVTDAIVGIGTQDNIENNLLGSLYLQNGADQLSDRSAFVQLTADIHIKDGIHYHTIMGDHQGLTDKEPIDVVTDRLSDGIVPYSSSRLEGADSETIITGKHNIHENPKTILQLRKILHEKIGTPHSIPTDNTKQTQADTDSSADTLPPVELDELDNSTIDELSLNETDDIDGIDKLHQNNDNDENSKNGESDEFINL